MGVIVLLLSFTNEAGFSLATVVEEDNLTALFEGDSSLIVVDGADCSLI
jgi:hypothetical protein